MNRNHIFPMIQALIASLLFGASAPLAKLFLGEIEPIPLAAFLYLGSGIGLLSIKVLQRFNNHSLDREARLKPPDIKWLIGAILAGGVAAPIILLFSLKTTPAATASLLLNFECVATTLIAAMVFKESIGRRVLWSIMLITLSSILLSIDLNGGWGISLGAFGIIAACVLWGFDNNFTRNISAKDPLSIVTIKGLGAGTFSLGMAITLGNAFPRIGIIVGAMLLGFVCYGLSIVLFIRAMRGLGAARTSALFSTAPAAGLILSIFLFNESLYWLIWIAIPLMVIGTILLVNENHEHVHTHKEITHEHIHTHDDGHHNHKHQGEPVLSHSHLHTHEEVTHIHPHMPDIHHRHTHSSN
jgi:drug/metabolite transporter (DMT)-like permease